MMKSRMTSSLGKNFTAKFQPYLSHRRYLFIAFAFALGLFILEIFLFARYYQEFFYFDHLRNGNYLIVSKLTVMGAANFLVAVFFITASLLSPYRYRIIYFVLFCIAVLPEYGYQRAFTRFTTLEDIGNAFFAANVQIIFSAMREYFVLYAVIPCVLYAALLLLFKPLLKNGLKIFLSVLVLYGGFFLFTAYFSTNFFPSVSFNAFYRTVFHFPVSWYFGSIHEPPFSVFYQVPRQQVTFRAQKLPNNNIVLIIDESMRGDHLSLNGYSRLTTPFLDELNEKGFIKNWGVGVSGTTCSFNSNSLLLTGVTDIPDVNGDIYRFPTIFQYAKAMGYKTYYFDGLISYRWIGKPADAEFVDEWLMSDTFTKEQWYDNDAEIAERVREIVGNSTGNFIWINKFGVHFPYNNSYPDSETKWLPKMEDGERFSLFHAENEHEKLKNSYDNAILYNSQSFFANLLGNGLAADTFYIYTSDHGQNLSENGNAHSHCLATKPEANVPLLMVADPQNLPETDTGYKASHRNIFPTLLDLMDFPEAERRHNYALSLLKAKSADSETRFYYTGNLHSKISAQRHAFDE